MQTGDIVAYARFLAGEPSNTGRFSDPNIILAVDTANPQLAIDLGFPSSTWTLNTTGTQQEYPLPPVVSIQRAYITTVGFAAPGQPIIPTTLDRLEGVPLRFFDQTALQSTPTWTQVPAATYPVTNPELGWPTATGLGPYNLNSRPQMYRRGGVIGFVPTPLANQTITLQGVPIPPTTAAVGDNSLFPSFFKRALACFTVMQMYEADENQSQDPTVEKWAARYVHEMRKLRSWMEGIMPGIDFTPQFVTYRTYWSPPFQNTSGNMGMPWLSW